MVRPRILRQLATAAAVLSMLWEARSHLRRQYGINSHVRQKEAKANTKELNKAPSKVHGITGDRFWEAISKNMACLDSEENMRGKCRDFATLLSIDDELKVAGDDDMDRDSFDDGAEDDMGSVNGSKPMKRKDSLSGGLPLKRPKHKHRNSGGKKRTSSEPEDALLFN
jgi:cohesin loading factor subunit SCC2